MEFEWDGAKQESNLRKHRLDFADVATVFAGATFTFADDRFDYGEDRFITVGLLHGTRSWLLPTQSQGYDQSHIHAKGDKA